MKEEEDFYSIYNDGFNDGFTYAWKQALRKLHPELDEFEIELVAKQEQ